MNNYEHVMILGKVLKLAKRHLKDDNVWKKNLEDAYKKAKTAYYFGVPVLPKKMDLEVKKDLLLLPDM